MTDLTINGKDVSLDVPGDTPLLWALRDNLRLTGTKFGCGVAQCGACTVMVDGMPVRSCITPVEDLEGSDVTTIEALEGPEADAVRKAWVDLDVPQCGYCQSGQIIAAATLLTEIPQPTDEDIDFAMAGNACRCATYVRIRKAIHNAAKMLEA
ncbi:MULTISPECIES: (2Fe-2S)-binding protein [unclassified Ruegeria]|uniref:(2Fe-2S)-binding protein n=1 Tax=unclassified Ruegeria TaxID=2625375 RepID=UPI001490D1ED|nr:MULTISPECIES: (2Fe-2S)-binding protein [unclassified Ruegeria]NOD74574.1 2Fe-2S iron-sulfur cluster binding domain-containing protein [Ruegeria sp. HKCCD4332]NOD88693.1 2Fe-2S iron-sulfur cluster binding domain-containing protein [Ruegeria sp. HKCCD4318]NOE12079.1 2Fe-2S iron-sulfur cluster binding domain-containing protein [Ruegeria sp. HKCCD4318-2]NOG09757.1 (2Fe-2S)-binding protein [Ruegeria sp. HKCCD4315]